LSVCLKGKKKINLKKKNIIAKGWFGLIRFNKINFNRFNNPCSAHNEYWSLRAIDFFEQH